MSGGSFEYLYNRLEDQSLDSYTLELLQDMISYLEEQGEVEASQKLKEINQLLSSISVLISNVLTPDLLQVVKDVEWWGSGDIGRETFEKRWEEYKTKNLRLKS